MNDLYLSIVLALIQGITEFLPVSSSAHLLFPSLLFGSDDLGLPFDIALHAGTLVAVIYFFKNDIFNMARSFLPGNDELKDERNLAMMLIVATLPIIFAGFVFYDFINGRTFNITSIAISNILFGFLLLVIFFRRSEKLDFYKITFSMALIIGIFQCFSLIPGASRSGTAITGALLIGLNLKDSSKFAFLLSIPTILAALSLLIIDLDEIALRTNYYYLIIGFSISMFVAFTSIKYFLKFVEKIGMVPFVIYRFILGLVLLTLF